MSFYFSLTSFNNITNESQPLSFNHHESASNCTCLCIEVKHCGRAKKQSPISDENSRGGMKIAKFEAIFHLK